MFTGYTKASYCRMIHGRSDKYDGAEAGYIILGVRRSDGFAAGCPELTARTYGKGYC